LNKRRASVLSILLIASFVGVVYADTISNSATRTTLQTGSADIEVLKFGVAAAGDSAVLVANNVVNLTAGFAFSPKNLVQVNSVGLTVVYCCSSSGIASVRLNGLLSGSFTVLAQGAAISVLVGLQASTIHLGSNSLEVSTPSSVQVNELRLTVEYTFMG
jgi:hypothetical protein